MIDKIKTLRSIDLYVADHELDDSAHFSDLSPTKDWEQDNCYIVLNYMQGSDYGGSTAAMANYRVFVEEFEDYCVILSGIYNSYGIAISVNWLMKNSKMAQEVMELLIALEDYF